jgi:hypothetical protein
MPRPPPKPGSLLVLVASLSVTHAAAAVELPDARDTSRPCRPTISCTAEITAPGTLEVESGAQATRLGDGSRALAFPILLKQTFTPLVQLQLGSNGYTTTTSSTPRARYLDNVFIGTKLHVLDQAAWLPALALGGQWSFPTFEATGYARNHDALFTGYASKDVGPIHLDLNVGANVYRLEAPLTQGFGAFAASASLPDTPFGVAIEGYAFSDAAPATKRDAGIRSFIAVSPRPWWVFDVGGDIGLVAATRAYSLFVGMTIVPVVFARTSTGPP